MKIGIDIDGVVADISNSIKEFFNINPEKIKDYDLTKQGITQEKLIEFLNPQTYKNMEPIKDAAESIKEISKYHQIYFISARNQYKEVKEHTIQWLQNNGFQFDKVYCGEDKKKVVQKEGIEFIIEDNPSEIKRLSQITRVIIFTQTWNTNIGYLKNTTRAIEWGEIKRYLCPNEKEQ